MAQSTILIIVSIYDFRSENLLEWLACRRASFLVFLYLCLMQLVPLRLNAAGPTVAAHFDVSTYEINGVSLPDTNNLAAIFSPHTGTNIDVQEIALAAADLQAEYGRQGFPEMSVAVATEQITNGIVKLNVFQAALPQIVISGNRYLVFGQTSEATSNSVATVSTVATHAAPVIKYPPTPVTPEEMVRARTNLLQKMAELDAAEKDRRVHVVSTNAGPRFDVEKYLVTGNSVLTPSAIALALTNIDGAYGTNVGFDGVRAAVTELQGAYRDRGYVTVSVGVPQQKLTNATVKLQVTEGRLVGIDVKGNHYFSSNNVMRALPSLHPNTILNGTIFQDELNRANANQDRQIYPVIGPGPDPGESELTLKVKDQLPLHGKVDLNNENSPGTPTLRVNTSAVYDNLWQLEHSLGVQYSFSPEAYKEGRSWDFYDRPLVANYSAFYRMPLGNPEPVEDIIANNPANFGYSEETRRFNLPPPTGQTELTLYASRSTIDTGLQNLSNTNFINVPGVRTVSQAVVQQDITINETMGFRLTKPLPEIDNMPSTLSGGLDFKIYTPATYRTNEFNFTEITRKPDGSLNPPIVSSVDTPVPSAAGSVEYLPLALHYDTTLNGILGTATLGLDASGNPWFSGSTTNLQSVTGSTKSTGHWVTLDPSLSWLIAIHTNWMFTLRANGQWASEPLISTEQFGAGGVNSVRGYHEGELFGDEGWHVSLEQATPPHVVGMVNGNIPLAVRGSVYMDYARIFLLDPQGRPGSTALWGTGFGATAAIGSHWEARFLFSLPLLSAGTVQAGQPYFNFGLTAQF